MSALLVSERCTQHGQHLCDSALRVARVFPAAEEAARCTGWYADPKHWRRNTAIAVAGMFLVGAWAFRYSARNEQHHNYPTRPIPSQRWCKNFPEPNESRIGGAT